MTLGSLRGSPHSPIRPGAGAAARGCRDAAAPAVTMTRMSSTRPSTRVPAAPFTGPRDVATLDPVPHGRTARRLDWTLLPPAVRRRVEDLFGTPVVSARSAGAGYTPGCASVLTGADGRRIFLKAASTKAQRPFADAYVDEIRNLRALPTGVPAPRLLWSHEDDLWVLLGLEYVDGANPARPWDVVELGLCLDTLEVLAQTLTPPPMSLRPFAEDFAALVPTWDHVRHTSPQWPHLEEAAALAAGFGPGCEGDTLVHTDARDDNFLVGPDGVARLCDWNW